ncbi:MAG: CC0125/CC1285 family lipoprotein [Stenotrophobium sp.]
MIRHAFLFATLLTLLAGCATQTPYQPAEKIGAEGYTETQLTANRYRVTFVGNAETPAETVKDYALLRAGELTLQKGYDWFQLANRDNDKKQGSTGTVDTGFGFPGQTSVYQSCGLLRCNTTVIDQPGFGADFGTVTTAENPSYSSSLEVVMGRNPMPDSVESYDARQLVTTLRARMHATK